VHAAATAVEEAAAGMVEEAAWGRARLEGMLVLGKGREGEEEVRGWEECCESEEGEGGELHFSGLLELSRSLERGDWTKEREWEVEMLGL
jgi:hypothetical protein